MTKAISKEVKVADVLTTLQTELNSLTAITDNPFKTKKNLSIFGYSLETVDVKQLIKMQAAIIASKRNYDEAASLLFGKNAFPIFEHEGYSADDITHDIKLRMNIIQYDTRKKELESLVNEAKSLMSKEDQLQILMSKVQNLKND